MALEQVHPPKHGWNAWIDETYSDIENKEAGISGRTNSLTFGADKTLDSGLVLGFTLGWLDAKSEVFDGAMVITTDGINFGPYLAKQISARWMFDASLNYSDADNDQEILVFKGGYGSTSLTGSMGLTGQYGRGRNAIRPRIGISYGRSEADGYQLAGTLASQPIEIAIPANRYDTGMVMLSVEFSRTYFTKSGAPWMPYLNVEADWSFQHIGKGDTLTGDLSETTASDWTGAARVGVRLLAKRANVFTLSIGYTSFGQRDTDIIEGRLYFSHSF